MNLVPNDIKEAADAELMLQLTAKNPAKSLLQLQSPIYGADPNEIIRNRFLYRGGICILSAPTGVGKSSFVMQWAMHLACCETMFGLQVGGYYTGKHLRVLVIQAENDEGDLAETRDGVIKACGVEMAQQADEYLSFVTMPDACAGEFAVRLNAHCEVYEPDVVIIDPVFSFLGGDNNAQKDVSNWVRNLINPVLMKHKVACIMTHHENKPQKDKVAAGAYSMSGSAEWANAARCCLAFQKAGDGLYWLIATKRGQRLGWKDEAGQRIMQKLIAHHGGEDEHGRPIIAWRDATYDEIQSVANSGSDSRKKCSVSDVVRLVKDMTSKYQTTVPHPDLVVKLQAQTGASERTVRSAIKECLEIPVIEPHKVSKKVYYSALNQKG